MCVGGLGVEANLAGPKERGQVSFEFVGDCFGYSLPLLVHSARVDPWMPLTMLREAVRLRHSTLRQTRLPEKVMGSPVATCSGKQDRKWLRCQREIVRTATLAYSGASKEESWIWLFLRRTCHGPASASLELSIPGGGCRALGGSSV